MRIMRSRTHLLAGIREAIQLNDTPSSHSLDEVSHCRGTLTADISHGGDVATRSLP